MKPTKVQQRKIKMLLTFFQSSAVGWYSSSDEYSPSKYWEFRAATERNKQCFWGGKGTKKGTPIQAKIVIQGFSPTS